MSNVQSFPLLLISLRQQPQPHSNKRSFKNAHGDHRCHLVLSVAQLRKSGERKDNTKSGWTRSQRALECLWKSSELSVDRGGNVDIAFNLIVSTFP